MGNIERIIARDDLEGYIEATKRNRPAAPWDLVLRHNSVRIWEYLLSKGFELPDDGSFKSCFLDSLYDKRWDVVALVLRCTGIKAIYRWMCEREMARDVILISYLLTKGVLVLLPGYIYTVNNVKCVLLTTIGWSCVDIVYDGKRDGIWGNLIQHLGIIPEFEWEISSEGSGYCDLSYYDNILILEGQDLHETFLTLIREGTANWMKRLLSQITKDALNEEEQEDIFRMVLANGKPEEMKLLREKGIPPTIVPEFRELGNILLNW